MKVIRSLTSALSSMHRIFFTLGFAGALIAGLLAMHTLSAGDTHVDSTQSVSASHGQYSPAIDRATFDEAQCAGDCGAPGPMPHHSTLLIACALAVLTVVIVVFAPAQLARLRTSLSLEVFGRDAAHALLHARPPSLLVLSISRT
jgi:hypothetical protein